MSLLMDALRRAEAEKKHAAARRENLSIDLPESASELRLEPLDTSTERPMRVLGEGDTSYDQDAVPTRQQATRPGAARDAADASPDPGAFLTAPVGPGSAAQPTVVTAQTVFDATRGGGVPRALIAIIVCTVLLAAGLTAVGVYAYRQTPPTHTIPSPRVAARIETPALVAPKEPVAAAVTPPAAPAPEPPAAPDADSATLVAATPPAPTPIVTPATPVPPATPVAAAPTLPPPLPAPPVRAPPLARTLANDLPRDAEIASGEVHIARHAAGGVQADEVTRAYGAFQLGKLDAANDLYRRALQADPQRVDALLGLAAIAMRENRLADAHRLYRQVLAKSPRHAVATAALFMIEGGDGNEATEAHLKLLADKDADSPYLHFALGNLYARRHRWTDAQEAYFAAYTRAPGNADYAYNLAVSLDQIGQRKAALEYYRKALDLRQPGASVFDATRARDRVAALVGAP